MVFRIGEHENGEFSVHSRVRPGRKWQHLDRHIRPDGDVRQYSELLPNSAWPANLAAQRCLVQDHMDLRWLVAAEQCLLPGRSRRDRPGGVLSGERRPGVGDHLAGVTGCLEDARDDVGVNPDAARGCFHADVGAGEHVAVGGPPAAFSGVAAELYERLPLR